MNAIPEVLCGWCKGSATDPKHWMTFRGRTLPLCRACKLNIKQALSFGRLLAKKAGEKLGLSK